MFKNTLPKITTGMGPAMAAYQQVGFLSLRRIGQQKSRGTDAGIFLTMN